MGDAVLGTLATVFFWTYFLILIGGTAMTLIFLLALVRGRKVLAQVRFVIFDKLNVFNYLGSRFF